MIEDFLCVDVAKHCIGLDHKKPYKRHGKLFYRPYRNYFNTQFNDVVWLYLQNKGYADNGRVGRNGLVNFWLTRKGLDWLGEQLVIKIYDEED